MRPGTACPISTPRPEALVRLIRSQELARYILTLGFDEEDQTRMSELAEKNQQGSLSSEDREELQHYVKAGHLLALLHSEARKSLKAKNAS
jgi:hypothetical protein